MDGAGRRHDILVARPHAEQIAELRKGIDQRLRDWAINAIEGGRNTGRLVKSATATASDAEN